MRIEGMIEDIMEALQGVDASRGRFLTEIQQRIAAQFVDIEKMLDDILTRSRQ